jgi:hypothetical protein
MVGDVRRSSRNKDGHATHAMGLPPAASTTSRATAELVSSLYQNWDGKREVELGILKQWAIPHSATTKSCEVSECTICDLWTRTGLAWLRRRQTCPSNEARATTPAAGDAQLTKALNLQVIHSAEPGTSVDPGSMTYACALQPWLCPKPGCARLWPGAERARGRPAADTSKACERGGEQR